jgi:hypothetical protein
MRRLDAKVSLLLREEEERMKADASSDYLDGYDVL